MNVLVTGGAGYIGSHATRQLIRAGHAVTVLDDLSHGHREAVDLRADFVEGQIEDRALVKSICQDRGIEAVLHFAAFIEVCESVSDPFKYYDNNLANVITLLSSLREASVRRFVFSSTASVYGTPIETPITEDHPCVPINPYGRTKRMMELILRDLSRAEGFGVGILRYFNVAGASADASIGEAHEPESHLIPRILAAAAGKSATASIFGTDYSTPDGTCVRDYVHVEDLVEAHLLTLERLAPGQVLTYNLGSERGFSVRQVIQACERVTGRSIAPREEARRPGDPPVLIAGSAKIRRELGWQPRYPDLETMVRHAWNWHTSHPRGYG